VITGSNFGKVRSLDARTGDEVWSFKSGYWITAAPAVFSLDGRDWIGVGSYDQRFYVLDARTGERRWSLATAGPVYSSAAVASQEPETLLVFGSFDHRLYGASASDGSPRFSFFTGEPVWQAVGLGESQWSSPVVAEIDGTWMIYTGSYSGSFFGIPLNQAALGGSTPWSNLRFWITLAMVMAAVAATALWLTRRARLQRGDDP
jgi:outer membrane protein assembly factor BamB